MEPIKIVNDDIKRVIQSGHSFIQVDKKKFLLMEVEEANSGDFYKVTGPEKKTINGSTK